MPINCKCPVCLSLSGIPRDLLLPHQAEELLHQLPQALQDILAAQSRVRLRLPHPGDEELVKQAGNRCTAGRFAPQPPVS